jgi:starch synthase
MKIFLASSEIYPYSKTGGLADMVGALAKTLAHLGHRVGVVTPLYLGIREQFPELQLAADLPLDFPLGNQRVRGEVWSLDPMPGLTIHFVDQPAFFQRATLYQRYGVDYPDHAERFLFFSKAAAHLSVHLPWKPELLHVHDWQAAPAALLLEHQRRIPGWESAPRTCLTIHNLAYQGVFPASQFALFNLPWEYFNPEAAEFYNQVNCLKTGIAFADLITTVSPRYAREITTEELGAGLDGLLRHRQGILSGILNGVDYEEWNTTNNPRIPHPYSASDWTGKSDDKRLLQQELGLPEVADIPLFGSIGRLVEQKGVNLMLTALEEKLLTSNFQFVLLGTGLPFFEQAFRELAQRYPGKIALRIGFEESLSHRIEAGCDFFLMPSRFEPCGLNQMYSLRYGTIPIVRRTGGLDDTVTDIRDDPVHANGIKFTDASGAALAKAIEKALVLYKERELFGFFRENAIAADFSWNRTADEYLKVYEKALRR